MKERRLKKNGMRKIFLKIENRIFWWLAIRHVSHTAFYPNFGDLLARHQDHGCRCKLCTAHRARDEKWRTENLPAPPQACA